MAPASSTIQVLKISLRPSWLLAGILALAHAAAIAVVLLVGVPLWSKVVTTAVLLVHFAIIVRQRALLLSAGAVVAIEIGSDNKVSVRTQASGWEEFEVLGNTFVAPWMTILNLRQESGRGVRRVALFPDSLHPGDFRKLRVWLRWKEDHPAP